jgi:glycyl-tRNA synthetase beta chain
MSLDRLLQWSLETHGVSTRETSGELNEFFEGRLRFLFEEMGYTYDCIHAVLAAGFDDPLDALERLRALHEMREEADFLSLASSFKRIVNILSQAEIQTGPPEEARLIDPAEQALWQRYLGIRPEVEAARKGYDYGTALRSLASMRGVVDAFFNEVLVMVEDLQTRSNRLSLLSCVAELFKSIADISRIVVEKSA